MISAAEQSRGSLRLSVASEDAFAISINSVHLYSCGHGTSKQVRHGEDDTALYLRWTVMKSAKFQINSPVINNDLVNLSVTFSARFRFVSAGIQSAINT